VELAVVLALIGLLALLAYPSFDRLTDRLLLRSASVTLVQTLRTIRHRALMEGRAYTVIFDPAARCYRISGGRGEVIELARRIRFGAGAGVLGPPSQPTQPVAADGVSFRTGQISFQPDGTLSPGPGTIYLTSGPSGPTLAISLNMAGHLRRYRWEGGRWEPI
jgi:Tfp pilus assembly protein FimT